MTRAVYRFVDHTINHAPEGGYTFEIFCTAHECGEDSGPQCEQNDAQDWALRHTGRTGHDLFRRVATDHARVTRADQGEGERIPGCTEPEPPAVETDGTD